MWAMAIPAAMQLASSLMNKSGDSSNNPSNAAGNYYQQAQNMLPGYYNPYIQQSAGIFGDLNNQYSNLANMGPQMMGQASSLMGMLPQLQGEYGGMASMLPQVQGQYSNLMNNPGGVVNQIGQSFHQSPGFGFQTQQATNAANQAAAAGGMLGSPQEQQNLAGTVNGLANQDYYNYLNTATNEYNQGLGGAANMGMAGVQGQQGLYNTGLNLGQNLYGSGLQGLQGLNQMGFGASMGLGDSLANLFQNQGQNAYAGQINQNNANTGNQSNMMQGAGGILQALLQKYASGMGGGFGGGASGASAGGSY